jgi:peptidyl-prolyl cis-trans isomerase A (cyclophilin A)
MLACLLALSSCSKNEAPAGGGPGSGPATTAAAGASTAGPAAPLASGTPGGLDGNAPIFHPEKATEQAPETFKVKFVTTKGDFVIEVTRAWSPLGADRFYNLIKLHFYDGCRFYRAVENFMVQFGINGDPQVNGAWYRAFIPDDPVVKSNKRGFVAFAKAGPNMRTTQIYISYVDKNARLDALGFSPFGQIVDGMKVVDSLYKGYGESQPSGKGPMQGRLQREGNAYLEKEFPELDWIKEAKLL